MFLYILPVLAYLSGALPFGWMIGKWIFNVNIRHHGSGATGATQLWRTLRQLRGVSKLRAVLWFGLCCILDLAKAAIPTGVAILISDSIWYPLMIGWICCIAHTRSAWLLILDTEPRTLRDYSFSQMLNGGKAVACAGGVTLAFAVLKEPLLLGALGFGFVVMVASFALSRKMSIGSLFGAGTAAMIVMSLILTGEISSWYVMLIALAAYILLMHRDNVSRIMKGEENETLTEKRSRVKTA